MLNKLKKNQVVETVIQFGSSLVRKDYRDIDICILTKNKISLKEKIKVISLFPEIYDISFYEDLPLNVKQEVLRGKILFCRNKLKLFQEMQKVNDGMFSYSRFLEDYHRERMRVL